MIPFCIKNPGHNCRSGFGNVASRWCLSLPKIANGDVYVVQTSVGQPLFLNKHSHETLSPKEKGRVHAWIFQNSHHSFIHSIQLIMTTLRWFTSTTDVWQEFHLLAKTGTTPAWHQALYLMKKSLHQLTFTRSWSTWSRTLNTAYLCIVNLKSSMRLMVHGVTKSTGEWRYSCKHSEYLQYSVDKTNQLDVTFCILYFSSNSCSTCFGQPCAHHQELTTAWCYSLVLVCA